MGNVGGVAVSKLDAKYMFEGVGIIPENTNLGIKSNVVRNIMMGNQLYGSLPITPKSANQNLVRWLIMSTNSSPFG